MQDELLNLLKETRFTISQDSNSCNFYNDKKKKKEVILGQTEVTAMPISCVWQWPLSQ